MRVSSFKYLGVNISEDLTWTAHIQTQVKKARQRLYHLRQLRKFRVSPAILKTFYSGAIESVLTQCISVWYSNATNQDCKALQRVVRLAERISGSALPSLQDIYLKRCKRYYDNQVLFFLLSTFFYFSYTTSHHNIQHITKQNNRHILNNSKVQSKGRERGNVPLS